MKKTLKTRKGLVPALLATLCSVGALTTVSYAWFTMGNTASVGEVEVNVHAADGMQISANASDWKSVLPFEDLTDEDLGNYLPTKGLFPVSSVGKVSSGKQEMFVGKLHTDGTTVIAKQDSSTEGNYIMFDLYVKLDGNKTLNLAKGSKVLDGKSNNSHLASRVSFIDLGNADTPTGALDLNGTGVTQAKVWEPNANTHTSAANLRYPSLNLQTNTDPIPYEGISALTETSYDEGYKGTTLSAIAAANLISTNYNASGLAASEEYALLDLEAGYNKVRVYIWLEGQDVDCLNDLSQGSFKVSLNFSATDPIVEGGDDEQVEGQ